MKKTLILLGMLALTPQFKAQLLLEALDAPDKQKCTPPVNNFTPSDRCLELVCDRNYGDGDHDFVYCAVQGPNGKKWLNLNLGAEYAKVGSPYFNPQAGPTGFEDWKAFGSLFQDGRKADGHELVTYYHSEAKRDYLATPNLYIEPTDDYWYVDRKYPVTETPQDALNSSKSYVLSEDWMTNREIIANLWQGSMLNNPCPDGYRIMNDTDIKSLLVDNPQIIREDENQGFVTTSIFSNTNYPNLVIMTSPTVILNPNYRNSGKYQQSSAALIDERVNEIGSSALWILLNEDTIERDKYNKGAYYYSHNRSKPYGWQYYAYPPNPIARNSYYGQFDRGVSNTHEYGYSLTGKGISLAIRCVEM